MVYNKVSIPGYNGTFDIKPGEQIVEIDGVPVRGYNSSRTSNVSHYGYSGGYIVNAYNPSPRGWRVRLAQPTKSCQMVNGVMVCN